MEAVRLSRSGATVFFFPQAFADAFPLSFSIATGSAWFGWHEGTLTSFRKMSASIFRLCLTEIFVSKQGAQGETGHKGERGDPGLPVSTDTHSHTDLSDCM